MSLSCSPDISLYELALSSDRPPQPLQVSPTTFKSVVSVYLDLLIEHKVPATVWMKLPRGEVWQAELDRYRRLASAPYTLYTLNTFRDDMSEKPEAEQPLEMVGFPSQSDGDQSDQSDTDTDTDTTDTDDTELPLVNEPELLPNAIAEHSKFLSLPLSADSQLRREYFLLIVSPEFHGLVLAHRPRTVRPTKPETTGAAGGNAKAKGKASQTLLEEDVERKHPLLGLCSYDYSTIQRVLEGVNRAICFGQTATEPTAEVEELLVNWDRIVSLGQSAEATLNPALNPILLGHLHTRQIQRQEELWINSAVYRKQAEAATALQLENEEFLNSIRLKDEFLKNVGQELRTPLATMKTALTLLNSPNLKPAQRQRYMDMISQECDRQSSLITSVLDLIQLENMEEQVPTQPLRLTEVLPGVVSTYQPLAQEKGIMLAYTVPEDLPTVSCSSTWLRQIVINLLHNAIKFTPKGGRVWVRAKQQGDYVQIEFRDTGVGIPAVEIPKIFERFYRIRHAAADDSSGTGLGLSIVQQLLLRCGGSISVKSKVGEGSAFTVLLPIYR